MNTDRDIMQQALEALVADDSKLWPRHKRTEAIAALRERLAQPEQEPVAHTLNCVCGAVWDVSPDGVEEMVHAPNPPQRKPLTDEEADELVRRYARYELIRAIEAAHGIKE